MSRDFAETCVKGEEMVLLDLDKRDMRSISKDSASTRKFKQRISSCLAKAKERFLLAEKSKQAKLDKAQCYIWLT